MVSVIWFLPGFYQELMSTLNSAYLGQRDKPEFRKWTLAVLTLARKTAARRFPLNTLKAVRIWCCRLILLHAKVSAYADDNYLPLSCIFVCNKARPCGVTCSPTPTCLVTRNCSVLPPGPLLDPSFCPAGWVVWLLSKTGIWAWASGVKIINSDRYPIRSGPTRLGGME